MRWAEGTGHLNMSFWYMSCIASACDLSYASFCHARWASATTHLRLFKNQAEPVSRLSMIPFQFRLSVWALHQVDSKNSPSGCHSTPSVPGGKRGWAISLSSITQKWCQYSFGKQTCDQSWNCRIHKSASIDRKSQRDSCHLFHNI